jgi:hypothetical protein
MCGRATPTAPSARIATLLKPDWVEPRAAGAAARSGKRPELQGTPQCTYPRPSGTATDVVQTK